MDAGSLISGELDSAPLAVPPSIATGNAAAPSADVWRKRRRLGCMTSRSFMGSS